MIAKFCNYEHMGGCSDVLTHRTPYWIGRARALFKTPYAHWCSNHAAEAAHLCPIKMAKPLKREPRSKFGSVNASA